MTAYDSLMAFQRETEALGQIAGRLGWDQETMMPRGAAHQRGEEMAALQSVLHARRTDARIGDWLTTIDRAALDPVATAQLREITRSFQRNTKVPTKLAAEIARVTSKSQGEWAEARSNEDFKAFIDRKKHTSNSSHTVISYAVFCLKKKKQFKKKKKKHNTG